MFLFVSDYFEMKSFHNDTRLANTSTVKLCSRIIEFSPKLYAVLGNRISDKMGPVPESLFFYRYILSFSCKKVPSFVENFTCFLSDFPVSTRVQINLQRLRKNNYKIVDQNLFQTVIQTRFMCLIPFTLMRTNDVR